MKTHHRVCLKLIAAGKNTRQISELMLVHARTIRRWYVILMKAGLVERMMGEWGETLGYRITKEGIECLSNSQDMSTDSLSNQKTGQASCSTPL